MKRILSLLILVCSIAVAAWAQNNNDTAGGFTDASGEFYKTSGELTAVEMMLHPFGIFDFKTAINNRRSDLIKAMKRFGWNRNQDVLDDIIIFNGKDKMPFTYKGHEIYMMCAYFANYRSLKSRGSCYKYEITEPNFSKEQAISLAKEAEKELAAYGLTFTDNKLYSIGSVRMAYWKKRIKVEVCVSKYMRDSYCVEIKFYTI